MSPPLIPSLSIAPRLFLFFHCLGWTSTVHSFSFNYSSSSEAEDFLGTTLSQHQHRHLQAIGGCSFDDLVSFSPTCGFSQYCRTTSPSTFIECGGNLANRWAIRLDETRPRCYNDPNNRASFFFLDDGNTLSEGGFCSQTTLIFSFVNGNALSTVESIETFSAPQQYDGKTLISLRNVRVCTSDIADWTAFGSQSYCNEECLSELNVDGEACEIRCVRCENGGRESFSCPNFFPLLGYDCLNSEPGSNFYTDVLAIFDQMDATGTPTQTPTLVPVPAPTRRPTPLPSSAPVRTPTVSPTRIATPAPQTSPPTTPQTTPMPTVEPTTTSSTAAPTLSPTSTDVPTRLLSSEAPSVEQTLQPTDQLPNPTGPPVESTAPEPSQAPSQVTSFFVDGPINLSPVFLSSDSTLPSTQWGYALVFGWYLIWICHH